MEMGYWRFFTKAGAFTIKHQAGMWHAMHNGESLGAYHSAEAAHGALITGSIGDLPMQALPKQLSDWPFYPTQGLFDQIGSVSDPQPHQPEQRPPGQEADVGRLHK